MRTVHGTGCWPGRAEGPIHWWRPRESWPAGPVADRAAEVFRFRTATAQGLADLEAWSETQATLGARVLLQSYRDAVTEDSWSRRVCALIDAKGLPACTASLRAAELITPLMARVEQWQERAERLGTVARWMAERLCDSELPKGVILAAERLGPLELLDLSLPALVADGSEPLVCGPIPLVWGVPGLGPEWTGHYVTIDDMAVTVDISADCWWSLTEAWLRDLPVCLLKGDPAVISTMARQLGRKPVALIECLEDLAAVPLFAGEAAAVAVDLDQVISPERLSHPGFHLLVRNAAQAAALCSIPLLAGGRAVAQHAGLWDLLGFSGYLGHRYPLEGLEMHALRRGTKSGL